MDGFFSPLIFPGSYLTILLSRSAMLCLNTAFPFFFFFGPNQDVYLINRKLQSKEELSIILQV